MSTGDTQAVSGPTSDRRSARKAPPPWLACGSTVASEAVQALGRRLVPAPATLMTMTVGYQLTSRAISAAAELGLADHLAAGPRALDALAAAAGADVGALARLLGLLERAGIVRIDQEAVIDRARHHGPLLAPEVRPRAAFESGDMFAAVPEGRDAYLMKWILHDWDDERAAAILGRIGAAARRGARLLLIELLIAPGRASGPAHQLDLAMLVPSSTRRTKRL